MKIGKWSQFISENQISEDLKISALSITMSSAETFKTLSSYVKYNQVLAV